MRTALFIFLLLATSIGCQRTGDQRSNEPVVLLDGKPFTRAEYQASLMDAHGDGYLRRFIDLKLVEREARRLGIKLEQAEVQAAITAEASRIINEQHRGKRDAFEMRLEKYGIDLKAWTRGQESVQRVRLLTERLMQKEVDPGAVRKLFEVRFGEGGVRRAIRQIFLSTEVVNSRLYTRENYKRFEKVFNPSAEEPWKRDFRKWIVVIDQSAHLLRRPGEELPRTLEQRKWHRHDHRQRDGPRHARDVQGVAR